MMNRMKREESADSLLQNGPRSEYVKRYPEHPIVRTKGYKPSQQLPPAEGKVDSVTVQRRDYPEHPIERRQRFGPDHTRQEPPAFDGHPSYKEEFPEWDLPPRPVKERPQWQQPEVPFGNKTTTQEFPVHPIERRKPFKPELNREELAPFDAQPSHREDYPEWEIPPRHQREKEEWKPSEVPFQSSTTSGQEFPAHQVSPRVNAKPDMKPFQSNVPFQASSDYHDTYREHEVQPRPRRPRETWSKPAQPMDATTTAAKDYKGVYAPPQRSMKPSDAPVSSVEPLDGTTTMALNYKAHELPIRYKHEPEKYYKPQGPMDLNTTMGSHYKEHQLSKQTYERPTSSHLLKGEGEMSKTTNYQGDFIERPIDRRNIMKPDDGYKPPVHPMDTKTTFQSDFFEKSIEKTQSYKPSFVPTVSDVPFQDRTVNKDTFVPHQLSPREQKPKEVYQAPSAPLQDSTTVRDSYKGAYQPPRESFKPPHNVEKVDLPFQKTTTNNDTFKQHKLPEKYVHRVESYEKPIGPMDLSTTNTVNYMPHQIERQRIQRPESSGLLRGHGEMVKDTTFQSHFQEPPPVKRERAKRPNDYQPSSAPLETTTTNRMSYRQHSGKSPRATSFKPQNDFIKNDAPFNGTTVYKDLFPQHEIKPRAPRPREDHKPPAAPFEARSTAHDSYLGPVQPPRGSFKPEQEYKKTELPFESNTTAGAAYKPWPTAKIPRHVPEEYIRPTGTMDLTTINREAFKEVRAERPAIHKQADFLTHGGKFEGTTSYGHEFVPKSMAHRKLVKPDNQYVPSSIPFENNTTYRASHLGYTAPKERSSRPEEATDVLGQRDQGNRFRIQSDWRDRLNMPAPAQAAKA